MKKRICAVVLCLGLLLSVFSGCAAGGSKPKPVSKDGDFSDRTLDVLLVLGGGGNYYEPVIERMKEDMKGLQVNLTYDINASDIMRQGVLSNKVPDIFNLNQGMYDYYGAIAEGVCAPLNDYLELPTLDQSAKLKDIVDTDLMAKGNVDGSYYMWPEIVFTSGLWYDANLLKEHNVKVPENWDEFLKAAEQLDQAGIDVLGYCGMMAGEYALDYLFYPFLISSDKEAFLKVQNLEDGAWDDPAVVDLVDRFQLLRDKGYIDSATIALGNSETQMEHIAHKFAFLPCGSWLEGEMADAWTPDWQLSYLPYSGRTDSKGDNYVHMISLVSGVSATTKNADLVGEFYRYLYSDKKAIEKVVTVAQNGLPIADFGKNYGSLLNQSTAQVWSAIDNGSKSFVSLTTAWYNEHPKAFMDAFNSFMGGQIDGAAFRTRMADTAKAIKADSEITKYEYK